MKKILVLLETEPEWGGAHQYASTVMDCLMESRGGIELAAVCGSGYWRKWCAENGVRILDASWYARRVPAQWLHWQFPLFSRLYSTRFSRMGKILREEGFDAVLCTAQTSFVPNMRIKAITPAHDLMHRYEKRFPEAGSEYLAREILFSSKAKYAWCVLADSELGKRQFMESYAGCMKRDRPRVVSMPFAAPGHIAGRAEEYVETPEKYVFYPAQFWKHKNHVNLIRAVKMLAEDIPDIHLFLAGSEKNNMKAVRKCISESRLEERVTIKGFVSDGNITYLYRHAVGMVMPSYFGPTNIPPLEAMALGCPVAVSNRYAMPEQVGDAGLLFDPDSPSEIAECIRKMWCDGALRQRMIGRGYEMANRWTRKEFGERLGKILEDI